ncbi:CopG family transcriptional regulator [Euhalothece natronophila Z-M001]|uniref:CopG family transcriptional regulator n=1 Tax=Euhalothece natronophila Z-M001 TaxID=522448 RepID=A0A5B8NK23_9CHRO|nr:ribbon-helix-helix domain-containing protein [Euhalothece natronophila]QDZ39326.1 CopG family transcriptional regulator [Euhalothece natronophila Z-M001]
MNSLTIQLPDEKLQKLQQLAKEKGITTEELIETKINEWLTHNPQEFPEVANYVVNKNADLYKRLA